MKPFLIISLITIPLFSFAQSKSTTEKANLNNHDSLHQDTARSTASPSKSGMQSSLAVSDEGASSAKTEDKKPLVNSFDKIKKNLTKTPVTPNSSGTTNNLAVSDEGSPSDKKSSKGKTARENTGGEKTNQGANTTLSSPK